MNKLKFKQCILVFPALLFALLLANTNKAWAQKEPQGSKLLKYELSIDLVPIIDKGQFGKVYLKKYRYKEDLLMGAYRFGVSKGTYFGYDFDLSALPEGTTVSLDNFSHFETGLFLGYEKYKQIGPVLTYYGLDITGEYFLEHRVPETNSMDQEIFTLGICPFWGIKYYILKNRVSVSFEIGWENSLSKNTNQYDGMISYFTLSSLKLPYNFTINYHF